MFSVVLSAGLSQVYHKDRRICIPDQKWGKLSQISWQAGWLCSKCGHALSHSLEVSSQLVETVSLQFNIPFPHPKCSSFLSKGTACSIVTTDGELLVEGDQTAKQGGSFVRLRFPWFSSSWLFHHRKTLISAQKRPFQLNLNLFWTRKLLPGTVDLKSSCCQLKFISEDELSHDTWWDNFRSSLKRELKDILGPNYPR